MKAANTGKKTHWLRTTLIVLILCGLAGCGIAAWSYTRNAAPVQATATLELTFQGADQGVGFNRNAYDISAVFSDRVLTAAIEDTGLDLTADQVRENLTVTAVYPEDQVAQATSYSSLLDFASNQRYAGDTFIATLYSVRLTDDFGLAQSELTGLLNNVLERFRAALIQETSYGISAEVVIPESGDYAAQIAALQTRNADAAAYAREIGSAQPQFKVDGKGFNDLAARFDQLAEGDLTRLSSTAETYGLSKKPGRQTAAYRQTALESGVMLEKKQEELAKLDELIAAYDKNEIIYLSSSNGTEKLFDSSTAAYDELIARRKTLSDEIAELNLTAAKNRQLLENRTAPAVPAETATAAEAEEGAETETAEKAEAPAAEDEALNQSRIAGLENGIAAAQAKEAELMSDFSAMIQALNAQYLNESTISVYGMKYTRPSLFSMACLKQAVKYAGALCAAGLIVCLAGIFLSRRKEAKRG